MSQMLINSVLLVAIAINLYYSVRQQNELELILQGMNQTKTACVHSSDDYMKKPLAWVYGENMQVGYLHHVIDLFKRIGFRVWTKREPPPEDQGDWMVLWAHEYPFTASYKLPNLKAFQKVNHFPGSGYITNKVDLATSGLKHIPQAFTLPRQKDEFLTYARKHPDKLWVQKDNNHRGIQVKSIDQLSLEQKGTFVQEFIQNPLLIDNKKFDIGLYVTMTSLNPLRVYIFDNEVLLRFCAKPYSSPFNASDLDSYVVGDQYTPIWKINSLAKYYVDLNMNMKASLNAYIKYRLNKEPDSIWTAMEDSIKTMYYMKEAQMVTVATAYPNMRNFFEMVRFDFTLDDQLNVYLMEANMSPNLASSKFAPNRLIYEQVIYGVFSLVGINRMPTMFGTWSNKPDQLWNMLVQDKDLAILPEQCSKGACWNASASSDAICNDEQCDVCQHCFSDHMRSILKDAYMEHMDRWHNRRLIPSTSAESPITLGHNNYLQDKWFIGKCLSDDQWCN